MITTEDVLKAIVECKRPNGRTIYDDVCKKLDLDDISLIPFLKELKSAGYIQQTLEDVEITKLGLSVYTDLTPKAKVKKSALNIAKFTLKQIIGIIVAVISVVLGAVALIYFGLQ